MIFFVLGILLAIVTPRYKNTQFYFDNSVSQISFFMAWNIFHPYTFEDRCKEPNVSVQEMDGMGVRYIHYNTDDRMSRCSQNINGNLVIVNKKWEDQLFKLSRKDMEREKRLVYGSEMMEKSRLLVGKCCGITDNSVETFTTSRYILLILSVLVPAALIILGN